MIALDISVNRPRRASAKAGAFVVSGHGCGPVDRWVTGCASAAVRIPTTRGGGMPAMRVCPTAGCPELTPGGPCAAHAREREQRRGTRQQRGYDARHERLRKQWQRSVDLGTVRCARCTKPILPGQAWHLDHSDDRTGYLGPSCVPCNTSAGGRAAHGG